jgi:uroporphyrinogen decarboxylase
LMNPKQRFLAAINRKKPDRLPVTTHHLMPSFLDKYLDGAEEMEFFKTFGMDPIRWIVAHRPDPGQGEYYDPDQGKPGFLEARRICTDDWRFRVEDLAGNGIKTQKFSIITPDKTMSMILQSDKHSTWVREYLIKDKQDIDVIAKYLPAPKCDVDAINQAAREVGDKALVRGHVCCFDGFGQPGCWQDFACLFGIEKLIMATFEDPEWVHTFLKVLQNRKQIFIRSMKGAGYDLIELGGGDASTTVISPDIFNSFVAPYDTELIHEAHLAGQRITYHTCGGMMPILEDIAGMRPDAMETFTPPAMGGDVKLGEAKKRIGDKVCMIGGFDQFNFFNNCSEKATRSEVRRCFEAAGGGGGYILSPSDHFFDADLNLIRAFADEALQCAY